MSRFEDVQIRQWVLDSACHVSKKGTKPECIIKKLKHFTAWSKMRLVPR